MATANAIIDIVLSEDTRAEIQELVSRLETIVDKLEEIEKRIGGTK